MPSNYLYVLSFTELCVCWEKCEEHTETEIEKTQVAAVSKFCYVKELVEQN